MILPQWSHPFLLWNIFSCGQVKTPLDHDPLIQDREKQMVLYFPPRSTLYVNNHNEKIWIDDLPIFRRFSLLLQPLILMSKLLVQGKSCKEHIDTSFFYNIFFSKTNLSISNQMKIDMHIVNNINMKGIGQFILWKDINSEAFTTLMLMLQQLLQALLFVPLSLTRSTE